MGARLQPLLMLLGQCDTICLSIGYPTRCWQPPRSLLAPSTMGVVHHGGAGLDRRLGVHVAPPYGVELDVPGGEADHALAVDRADALAIKADAPDRRGGGVKVTPTLGGGCIMADSIRWS